ncbi:hypothetical protein AVEN_227814-1 [Araneus ventricosus]|uniref:Uncharacterized protein n=1 Tax=Araneus ventricosus TaxID=182803 RepID=A0A4Y2HM82_ARAVE|nr:hypothetical protein AVEN_227814-1 [Araneus ventricosus]
MPRALLTLVTPLNISFCRKRVFYAFYFGSPLNSNFKIYAISIAALIIISVQCGNLGTSKVRCINVPILKQHEGYFRADLVILNLGQMTRTTPELAPPLPNFRTTPTGGRLTPKYDLTCNRPNTRRISCGIGFRAWNPMPPRPAPYR